MTNFVNNDSNFLFSKVYGQTNSYAFDLVFSMILTQFYYLIVYSSPYLNEYFKHLLNSVEYTSIMYVHPEVFVALKDYNDGYLYHCTEWFVTLYLNEYSSTFTHPLFVYMEIVSFFLLILHLFVLYFTYYNTSTSEDNLIDHDYLVTSLTVESEEEIGSIDDTFLTMLILTITFLWFFWMNGVFFWFSSKSIYMHFFSLFPYLYFLIVIMPLFLLFDYGVYFLTYLSGSGKSTSITIEFTFDYIALSIFFLRLIVQNVRLIFMVFAFTEFHEMLIHDKIIVNFNFFDELIVQNKGNYWNIFKNGHYYLFKFSMVVLNYIYELLHTFFMVIFQFIAFFAMIFWLFLFLYTMFSVEMHEAHFYIKRTFLKKKKDFFRSLRKYL